MCHHCKLCPGCIDRYCLPSLRAYLIESSGELLMVEVKFAHKLGARSWLCSSLTQQCSVLLKRILVHR